MTAQDHKDAASEILYGIYATAVEKPIDEETQELLRQDSEALVGHVVDAAICAIREAQAGDDAAECPGTVWDAIGREVGGL